MKLYQAFFIFLFFIPNGVFAEQRIRVCSQNIYRLGEKASIKSPQFERQLAYLVKRIKDANCSVIAIQELIGKKSTLSLKIANILADRIENTTGNKFDVILSDSNDSNLRNAFLISSSEFYIEQVQNWNHNMLPKLDFRSAPWTYSRGPLAVTLKLRNTNSNIGFFIVNDHLKSRSRGWKDPTGTKYELARVLSAAGTKSSLLEIKSSRLIEVFLGDRNIGESGACSQVLQGRLHLDDFRRNGECEISSEGSALCPAEVYKEPDMIPLLETSNRTRRIPLNTYRYRSKEEILDEIYIFQEDRKFVVDKIDRINAGTEGDYNKGSDHLLSWVEFKISS